MTLVTDDKKQQTKDILRFLTAGSVDDGKSTLIGRLLCDSKQIYNDYLEGLKRDSAKRGCVNGDLDYSLLLDGLKAEREQNITIDVAYRYFSTPRRKFIIADTPGHEQYTPNMATGASNAQLLLLLVNAQKGVGVQTRRHSFIAALMGIKHIIVVINKMDLVNYSQATFERIRQDFTEFSSRLPVHDIHFIPLSASKGDNVVERSVHMPWFHGKPLLEHLEELHIAGDRNLIDLRFPVQLVLRPSSDFRGYSGTVASGILRKGDEIIALPSGQKSRVLSIFNYKKELIQAFASQAVTITLENDIDISRGDMLVHLRNQPKPKMQLEAMLIWMNAKQDASLDHTYLLKHTSRHVSAVLDEIVYKIDIDTLHRQKQADNYSPKLIFNEIAHVRFLLQRPIFADNYESNRFNGNFILIDSLSNQTVGAGIIIDRESTQENLNHDLIESLHITRPKSLSTEEREKFFRQKGQVIWLTGLSGAGKTTIAYALERKLLETGQICYVLDGDDIRHGLNRDLGFSPEDRSENIRRVGEVAALFAKAGVIVIVALISPFQKDRDRARKVAPEGCFLEVYLNTPLLTCEDRDPKGLYKKARTNDIENFTGISAPYEEPLNPDLTIDTAKIPLDASINSIIKLLHRKN